MSSSFKRSVGHLQIVRSSIYIPMQWLLQKRNCSVEGKNMDMTGQSRADFSRQSALSETSSAGRGWVRPS